VGLVAWELAEGGWFSNLAAYNPLNTTEPMAGSTTVNSVGVRAYASLGDGLTATARTLRNGRYDAILTSLRTGGSPEQLATAVEHSPWGTGAGVFRTIAAATAEVAREQGAAVPAFTSDDDERNAIIRTWWFLVHHAEISSVTQQWCMARWAQTGSGDLVLAAIIDRSAPGS